MDPVGVQKCAEKSRQSRSASSRYLVWAILPGHPSQRILGILCLLITSRCISKLVHRLMRRRIAYGDQWWVTADNEVQGRSSGRHVDWSLPMSSSTTCTAVEAAMSAIQAVGTRGVGRRLVWCSGCGISWGLLQIEALEEKMPGPVSSKQSGAGIFFEPYTRPPV